MESTVFEREGFLLYISVKKSFSTFLTFFSILAYISLSVIDNMVPFYTDAHIQVYPRYKKFHFFKNERLTQMNRMFSSFFFILRTLTLLSFLSSHSFILSSRSLFVPLFIEKPNSFPINFQNFGVKGLQNSTRSNFLALCWHPVRYFQVVTQGNGPHPHWGLGAG